MKKIINLILLMLVVLQVNAQQERSTQFGRLEYNKYWSI